MTTAQLRKALDKATRTFNNGPAPERIGPLRFPRFRFLNYLLEQNPVEPDSLPGYVIREHEMRGLLPAFVPGAHTRNRHDQSQQEGADFSAKTTLRSTWEGLLDKRPLSAIASLVLVLGFGYMGMRLFHRVPRWIMRQPYLAPRQNGNLHRLVQRLLVSQHEDRAQVRKFLVHAFLEDLAENYTRRLKWLPKDSYPVLLIRNAREESLGGMLIRLINDVRNGTGASDPLLVIATGREQLNRAETPEDPPDSLKAWNNRLKQARRRRSPVAWYLPLQVADVRHNTTLLQRENTGQEPKLVHSKPLRAVPVLTVLALVISLGVTEHALREQHCGRWWPSFDDTDVRVLGEECVGYSAGEHVFTDEHSEKPDLVADLARAQRRVFANNAEVNERAANTDMPTYTVVYLGIFTADPGQASSLAGTAEELRGLVAAQQQMLEYGSAVRIHLANGAPT